MTDTSYRLQVGQLDCRVFSDGYLTLPGERKMDVNILFIRTGNHRILVDTGCGDEERAKKNHHPLNRPADERPAIAV
jgi:hypothetical protein